MPIHGTTGASIFTAHFHLKQLNLPLWHAPHQARGVRTLIRPACHHDDCSCAALLQGSSSKAVSRRVVLARLKKAISSMTWWQITRPSILVDSYKQALGEQHQSKQTSSLQLVSADGLNSCFTVICWRVHVLSICVCVYSHAESD